MPPQIDSTALLLKVARAQNRDGALRGQQPRETDLSADYSTA
jgi:hypothetical protein